MIVIGKSSFQEKAIAKMTLKKFRETYKDILGEKDLDKTYKQITGKSGKDDE